MAIRNAIRLAGACALMTLFALGSAFAQSSPFGNSTPNGSAPAPQPTARQAQAPAPAGTDAIIIARVEGRPITQGMYDRIAGPYFARMKAQFGDNFKGEVLKSARQTVLDELIRPSCKHSS